MNTSIEHFDQHLEAIRRFTDDELIPRESEMVAAGAVPADLVARMAELGLFGYTIPTEYGGLGRSVLEQILLTFEFTRASCVYRSRFSTTAGLAAQVLLHHGTEEQRRELLPKMAAGETVVAFALTEEHAGSDAAALRTAAARVPGGYRIDGRKRYITNGAWCDLLVVFARTDPGATGARGISAFLVPADTPGVTATPAAHMNGHAENPIAEVCFDGVEVPAHALVGGREGDGLTFALSGINLARTHVAATAVGQASRILEELARHVAGREMFSSTLAELGGTAGVLGRGYAELAAARALTLECARAFEGATPPRHKIAAAKLFCTEMVGRVADQAVQLLGGEGIVGTHAIPRMWRDVRALRIYEGASEVHERNLGRHVLQLAASADPGITIRS